MKKQRIEYEAEPTESPMTFWVTRPDDDGAKAPLRERVQPLVPGRGYPLFYVEVDGFEFRFSSLREIRACIEVLSQKLLPTTLALAKGSGGLNTHWLSRLPGWVKDWKYREKAVKQLAAALPEFERALAVK
jgi:hypothetical protein